MRADLISFTAITHVQLAMPRGGEDTARSFYRGALGLKEVPKPEILAARGGVWFQSGGVELHLGVEDEFRPAKKAHPAILVSSLGAVRSRLSRMGFETREGEQLKGQIRFYVDDPFGNRIEIVEHTPSSPMVRELRTERMLLRSLAESDREEFIRVYEEGAERFQPWIPNVSGTFEELFELDMRKVADPEVYQRWTGVGEDGRLVGFFNLGQIVRGVFQNAYISWLVRANLWGQGYATEGARAMLDLAFSSDGGLGLHRVQANIIPANERSIRVAERLGMRHEGTAKKYLKIAGVWQDHLMFAKTSDEHSLHILG